MLIPASLTCASSLMALRCGARAFRAVHTASVSLRPVSSRPSAHSRPLNVCCMASQAAPAGPKYYILNYKYVADIVEKRGPYREAHLSAARQKLDAGKLVMAGAAGDPVEGAVFIFKDITKEEIEEFVKSDPYVLNGLVPDYNIKTYAVVVGSP